MIKFNRYNVTDTITKKKAKVFYSLDNRTDRRPAVTIYAKDYGSDLGAMFASEYENNTDTMTDYFEKGSVVLFEDNPNYSAARNRAEENSRLGEERRTKRLAKFAA